MTAAEFAAKALTDKRGEYDPSCELFLGGKRAPKHSSGMAFVNEISEMIDEEMCAVTNGASIEELKTLRRRMVLFGRLVRLQIESKCEEIVSLRKQGGEDMTLIGTIISDMFDDIISNAVKSVEYVENDVYTTTGFDIIDRFKRQTQRRRTELVHIMNEACGIPEDLANEIMALEVERHTLSILQHTGKMRIRSIRNRLTADVSHDVMNDNADDQ